MEPSGSREPVPFHVVPGQVASTTRRLLLISYHFPPGATAGALRWQKLASFAASRGWSLDVISVHPEDLDRVDSRRLEDLPPGTRIFGVHRRLPIFDRIGKRLWDAFKVVRKILVPSGLTGWGNALSEMGETESTGGDSPESLAPDEVTFSPFRRADLRRAFHAWLDFVRDGVWADDAADVAFRLTDTVRYDAVLTSGPPHMAHVAGNRVAERTGMPFVMDLRDPWSIPRRRPEPTASPVWFHIAERHERSVVEAADLIVANTDSVRRAMEKLYPEARERFITVTNAADEMMERRAADAFVVTYAGAIYLDRDPRPLFRAASRVIRRDDLSPDDFRVELVGSVESFNGVRTIEIARNEGIADHVDILPPESHEALLERLARSSVLVSLPQDSPWAIPSKVFEYMQFQAWLLVYGYPGTPTWELLEETGVHLVKPDNVAGGAEALERCYQRFQRGDHPARIVDEEERFTRRHQASLLFDALEALPFQASQASTVGA